MKKIDDYNDAIYMKNNERESNPDIFNISFVMNSMSMEGIINPGEVLRTFRYPEKDLTKKQLPLEILPYWVICTNQAKQPLVKQIQQHNISGGFIICHSTNEKLKEDDFRLAFDTIQALFCITEISRKVSPVASNLSEALKHMDVIKDSSF